MSVRHLVSMSLIVLVAVACSRAPCADGYRRYAIAPEYVGLGVREAETKAMQAHVPFRVVVQDATCPSITADLNTARVSAFVTNGVVTEAYHF